MVHVVTPANADAVPDFLEQMWTLGVPWLRVTPVVPTGAAARSGDWSVSRERPEEGDRGVRRAPRGRRCRSPSWPGPAAASPSRGVSAPGSFLVRPNGDVRIDSLRPFTFGNAVRESVATCWEAIRAGWNDDRIDRWAGSLKKSGDMPKSDLVAYLDDEVAGRRRGR